MDNEAVLKLLIELGVINAGQVDNLREKLNALESGQKEVGDSAKEAAGGIKDLTESMPESWKAAEELNKSYGDLTSKLGENKEMAGSARLEHMALHKVFHELNKIAPGSGMAVMVLTRALEHAARTSKESAVAAAPAAVGFEAEGAAAAAATPEVAGFGVALWDALAPLLPFVALMLVVENGLGIWEKYKEKLKEVAKEAEESMGKVQDSINKAFEAQRKLEEALHPKPTEAEAAEKELESKKRKIQQDEAHELALNKAKEEQELALATSEVEKKNIREKWKNRNEDVRSFAQHELGEAEKSSSEKAKIEAEALKKKSENERKEAQSTVNFAQQKVTEAQLAYDQAVTGSEFKAIAKKNLEEAERQLSEAQAKSQSLSESAKSDAEKATALAQFSTKTGESAALTISEAEAAKRTRADVFEIEKQTKEKQGIQSYVPSSPSINVRTGKSASDAHTATLEELEELTHKSETQKAEILRRIMSHQITAQQAWEQMATQLKVIETRLGT
jgi:hypothetical protein